MTFTDKKMVCAPLLDTEIMLGFFFVLGSYNLFNRKDFMTMCSFNEYRLQNSLLKCPATEACYVQN